MTESFIDRKLPLLGYFDGTYLRLPTDPSDLSISPPARSVVNTIANVATGTAAAYIAYRFFTDLPQQLLPWMAAAGSETLRNGYSFFQVYSPWSNPSRNDLESTLDRLSNQLDEVLSDIALENERDREQVSYFRVHVSTFLKDVGGENVSKRKLRGLIRRTSALIEEHNDSSFSGSRDRHGLTSYGRKLRSLNHAAQRAYRLS